MRRASLPIPLVLVVGFLGLSVQPGAAQGTTGRITGQVTGENGQPLSGANVVVVGTQIGTLTGADGRYTIPGVPPGTYQVRASLIGYSDQTVGGVQVTAGETAVVDFQLAAQAVQLEELVAVGYGTARRQDVTGSVAAVRMENLELRPIRGATEALAAQVPGVRVLTSTGAPGSGAQVQIRGVSAIGAGATPLYVIDGMPITAQSAAPSGRDGSSGFAIRSPLADIPVSEIESITVLKDASAAAIYGSQAANGVVIITTKRGQASDRAQIDIQAYTGMQTPDWDRLPKIANAREFAIFMNRRWRQLNPGRPLEEMPEEWRDPMRYGEGTNWYREIMGPAPIHSVTASVRGGNSRVRALFSAGYLDQDGLVMTTYYRRLNARINLDASFTDRLSFAFGLAPTHSWRRLPNEGGQARAGALGSVVHIWPTDSPYDENGNLKKLVWGSVAGPTQRNPINVLREIDNSETTLSLLMTSQLSYELLDGVVLRSSFNVQRLDGQTKTFDPSTLWTATGPSIPSGTFGVRRSLQWVNENTINVTRQIGEVHNLQLLAGFTAQRQTLETGNFTGNNFPDDEIRTLNAAATITGNTGVSGWSMASVIGRLNYSLLDRYVLTATLRSDGSSRFGKNSRWGTFPSLGLAWNFSREPFMENVDFLSDGRLRVSFGYTGNNQIGNYSHFGNVTRVDYVFGGAQAGGMSITALGNPNLGWERTQELNVGLETSLFDNRVSLTAEAYRRVTKNLLLALELPTVSGFGTVTANQGSIMNRGFEIGVTTLNSTGPKLTWATQANLSLNRNKALDLGASDTLLSGASMEGVNTHITVVGQPIAQFYGYRIIGIYTPEDIADPNVPKYAGAVATDVKFKDVNGDGVIRQREDFEVIGNPWPKFTWGMTNTLTYGPFSFSATIDGQVGGQRLNRNLATIENIDGPFNVSKRYVKNMFISWDSIGDGKTPAAGSSSPAGRRAFRDVNDRWVMDAGFVWLRNIQLSYDLPQRLLGGLNARRARAYVSVDNAYIFTRCECNPQTEANETLAAQGAPATANLTPGVDNFSYPIGRVWTFGIDIGL